MRKALLTTAITAAAASVITLPALPANAQTVGSSCGTTVFTSCSDTEHYRQMTQWLGGNPAPAGCPSYIGDWGLATGTGNGTEHVNFNTAGNSWFTDTWTGDLTITFYPASSVNIVTDNDGNVTSAQIIGPSEQVLTGHMTQWDGGSFNKQASSVTFTDSFNGTDASGNPITVHASSHENWIPGSDPFGPPSNSHNQMTCG